MPGLPRSTQAAALPQLIDVGTDPMRHLSWCGHGP